MLEEIWRYPIKSCAGELLSAAKIGSHGIQGDRGWAFRDVATGHIASAKRPARWAPLLGATASFVGESVQIRFPDGSSESTADLQALNTTASTFLQRKVDLQPASVDAKTSIERTDPTSETLIGHGPIDLGSITVDLLGRKAPKGTFFDFAPIHVITTPTLRSIEAHGIAGTGDRQRFRPNLVLDIDGPPFQENDWPGRVVHVGDAQLEIITQTPRCVVPTLSTAELKRDDATLRLLVKSNRIETEHFGSAPCAGAYAVITSGGHVARGDDMRLAT